jgi:hypothetical protein
MQQATTPKSATKNETIVERTSDRELTVTRTFNVPAHIVFEAWTKPELLKQWWAPKSFGVSSSASRTCVGGAYPSRSGATQESEALGRYVRWIRPRGWSTSLYGCLRRRCGRRLPLGRARAERVSSAPALPEQGKRWKAHWRRAWARGACA